MPERLNEAQRSVFDKVSRHNQAHLDGYAPQPFLLNVDGTAGTGKSFLIDAISRLLEDQQSISPLRRLAPTGVAAFNIKGQTIHSALALPTALRSAGTFQIPDAQLHRLQADWSPVRYIIIDEKSMVGLHMLAIIDHRLRAIFPTCDLPFGGRSVLLFGDFGQLPPVGDRALYLPLPPAAQRSNDIVLHAGRSAYLAFNESIELSAVMRQAGTDSVTLAFKDTLSRLRSGLTTQDDYDLLSQRFASRVLAPERRAFDDSVLLASRHSTVHHTNLSTLARAARPVVRSPARHNNQAARRATDDQAQGLKEMVLLMAGAKVMITRNIWTQSGLTNGTIGRIEEIGYRAGDVPGQCVPSVVMVSCPDYTGPTEWHTAEGVPIVPITPVTVTFDAGGTSASRTQIPLALAYAITIHKSQGMTLDRARIDIGDRDFSPGLTFVACSRVKRLDGILFTTSFSAERIRAVGANPTTRIRAQEDQDRRNALGFNIAPLSGELSGGVANHPA
jgi:ATP-dependent exoDNAse (exonuclease V) alpha subunit